MDENPGPQGDGEHGQRSGLAGQRDVARAQDFPALVVPEILGHAADEPQPSSLLFARGLLVAEGTQGLLQEWRTHRTALSDQQGQAIKEEVGTPRRGHRRRRVTRRSCHLGQIDTTREAADEHRSSQRIEVGRPRQLDIQGLKTLRRLEQEGRHLAPRIEHEGDLAAEQVHPGALELIHRCRFHHGQQREGRIRIAGLVLGSCRDERALRAAVRVEGQSGRFLQEGSSSGQSTTRLCPAC